MWRPAGRRLGVRAEVAGDRVSFGGEGVSVDGAGAGVCRVGDEAAVLQRPKCVGVRRVVFGVVALVQVEEESGLPGGEGHARLRHSRSFACRRACRRVPEEVLADPLFADVEDRADLVEGAAEFSELVGGVFAADPRSLKVESGAGFVQCLVPFGGRAPCIGGGGRGGGRCSVVVVEPVATCGGDAPDDGGPAASFTLAACSFYMAGLLVPTENPLVGGQ